MTICKATHSDIPRMMEIFAIARRFMAETGNPNQWAEIYPSVEQLTDDIDRGDSYVCMEEGSMVVTFVLLEVMTQRMTKYMMAHGKMIIHTPPYTV